jgi:hypothetical protein
MTTTLPPATTRPAKPMHRATLLVQMLVDFGLPLVVYYGLRAAGVDQWWSLLLSAVVPVVAVLVKFVRTRTVDFLAVFVLSVVALSLGVSAMTGDARTMLIRDAWGGLLFGLIAVWLLASVFVGRLRCSSCSAPLCWPRSGLTACAPGSPSGTPTRTSGTGCGC